MELIKAVDAYVALGILSKEQLPFADSAQIFMQKKKLEPLYELFAEEEKKLVASVAKKDESGKTQRFPDGHFEFANEEAKKIYKNKMDEITTLDIGKVDTITITAPPTISAQLLEVLDGFVIFKEKNNANITDAT